MTVHHLSAVLIPNESLIKMLMYIFISLTNEGTLYSNHQEACNTTAPKFKFVI